MNAWWDGTPWDWIGIYVGGVNEYQTHQTNLSPQWIDDEQSRGWQLMPIWVGPQPQDSGPYSYFSTDPTTAYWQGVNEASAAENALAYTWGFANYAAGTPIAYDLEGSGPWQAATNSFIQGWVDGISSDQIAGVYGSSCGASLQSFATIQRPPAFIWAAYWDGQYSTEDTACINPGYWVDQQRLKQYLGNQYEVWNGVGMQVDDDCATGPVNPVGDGDSSVLICQ